MARNAWKTLFAWNFTNHFHVTFKTKENWDAGREDREEPGWFLLYHVIRINFGVVLYITPISFTWQWQGPPDAARKVFQCINERKKGVTWVMSQLVRAACSVTKTNEYRNDFVLACQALKELKGEKVSFFLEMSSVPKQYSVQYSVNFSTSFEFLFFQCIISFGGWFLSKILI